MGENADVEHALDGPLFDHPFHHQRVIGVNPVGELTRAGGEILRVGNGTPRGKLGGVAVEVGGVCLQRGVIHPTGFGDEFL